MKSRMGKNRRKSRRRKGIKGEQRGRQVVVMRNRAGEIVGTYKVSRDSRMTRREK